MLAVIKTGGKQYKVAPGQKLRIEKLDKKEGEEIAFGEVLLLDNEKDVILGSPLISGAKVTAKILKQSKADKVIIFKYKPKKRYKVKKGHRQPFTEVEILKIEA
ncbi:MAG: 50S ribosomal protein L21 [Candidatus Pacebacteria bacterium]|nr:50S ribosomal protein L21 [Candidatus Paceibacterota bacterium]